MIMELNDKDFDSLYGGIDVKIDNEDVCDNCIYKEYCIPWAGNVLVDIGNKIIVACSEKE